MLKCLFGLVGIARRITVSLLRNIRNALCIEFPRHAKGSIWDRPNVARTIDYLVIFKCTVATADANQTLKKQHTKRNSKGKLTRGIVNFLQNKQANVEVRQHDAIRHPLRR